MEEFKDEEFDPELLALADPTHDTILKPFLMITVILLGFWVIKDWREELVYFFSAPVPVALGEAMDIPTDKILPHNTYVKIKGIPTRRSVADRNRYFSLIGSNIIVEEKRADYIEDPIEREANGKKGDVDRVYFDGKGRLTHFSKMGGRYNGIREYYSSRYDVNFCEQLTPKTKKEIRQRKRDAYILFYQNRFDAASPDIRAKKGLKKAPTEAELKAFEIDDPVCIDAYFLQAEISPKSHLNYLIATIVFGLFMMFNLFLLVRWIRRFLGR